MYADDRGNIGYKTSAEIPLREDLEAESGPAFRRTSSATARAATRGSPTRRGPRIRRSRTRCSWSRRWTGSSTEARVDSEREPGSERPDVRQRPAQRAGGPAAGIRYLTPARGRQPQHARLAPHPGGARKRRQGLLLRDDPDPVGREAPGRRGPDALLSRRAPGGLRRLAPPALATLGADPKIQEAVAARRLEVLHPNGDRRRLRRERPLRDALPPTQSEIDAERRDDDLQPLAWTDARGDRRRPSPPAGSVPSCRAQISADRATAPPSPPTGREHPNPVLASFRRPRHRRARSARGRVGSDGEPGFAPAFGGSTSQADYRLGQVH